jgi:hypothetical protein
MIVLPRVVQRPSPNYTPVMIRHDLIFVHMCEGGYAGSTAWLCRREANASAHLVMSEDGAEVSQLVPLSMKAWAQMAFNGRGISLEIPGFTAQGIPEERWRAAAVIVAWLCREYGIPPAWAQGGQGRGIAQHVDLGAAGGGHHDCCGIGSPTWMAFLGYVKDAFDAFGPNALPPFALFGLPAAHSTELPPDAPAEPSHGGAARNEPLDAGKPHPTVSGFPHGSVADLQWRLNDCAARPRLTVDGFAGPVTLAAIRAFQATHGLVVDGVPGPATWAALDAAVGA